MKTKLKSILAIALCAVGLSAWAADPVTYLDWDDVNKKLTNATCTAYETVTASSPTSFDTGKTYVVTGAVTRSGAITVKSVAVRPARLILCDGAKLTASKGLTVAGSYALVICAQEGGTGALEATGGNGGAGIGGGYVTKIAGGTITINGGVVTATGGNGGAGIGGSSGKDGGTVTINGGTVTATGGNGGAGIGGGNSAARPGTVTFGAAFGVLAGEDAASAQPVAQEDYEQDHSAAYVQIGPPAPTASGESEKFAFDVREEIALAEGAVTIAGVSYSDTAWGAADPANVTLGYTNETTGAMGELKPGLTGEDVTEVDLPPKDGGYRLTHSTGKLTSFVKFTVSGYPLGSEGNPWKIGANAAAEVIAFSNGTDTVSFKPVRGTVTKAGLETITNAMGGASFTANLIAADGSETNGLKMVLGASGTAYDTIADALAANEASYTLFETDGYFVSYDANGAAGTMATDTFVPTIPTNLTANAYSAVGYAFAGWTTNGSDKVAYADQAAGVDFAQPGETLALKAKWTDTGAAVATFDALTNALVAATNQAASLPVTVNLTGDITVPQGGVVKVYARPAVTFAGTGKFDVTAEHPALFCGYPVGTGLKPEDLDRFVTDKDVKAYYEDGKVVVRGRGETEEFPWLLGTAGHEDEVTAWAIDGGILAKPTRGTASVAAFQSVTNALSGYVPGLGELKVISADGTATNNVVMLLGSDGVPYDTLAEVLAADPMPETVRLFEVKGTSVEFNAMGGVHTDGREIETNFCIVTYTLPEVERKGYAFKGWYVGWKPGAAEVTNGQDLVTFEPHALYAQWTAKNPTPKAGELDVPDVKNGQPVTTIEAGAYNGNASLSTVVTPLYLNSIGMYAFQGCSSLKTLTITAARSYDDLSPVKVTVAQNAFSGCSSLETVYVAAEIDKLGKSAFQSCAKLKRIVFQGDGTITYGSSAFYRCGYQNGTGSLKVYMSRAFQENNAALIADFKKWNTQVQIIEKVDVMPVNGIGEIAGIDLGSMSADRRVAVLVKTSVLGTPDPDDVDVEHTTELNGTWSPLKDGTEKTANPDGTVLIEIKVPEVPQGFFRAKVTE